MLAEMYLPNEFRVDGTYMDAIAQGQTVTVNGQPVSRGCIPRPYDAHPVGSYKTSTRVDMQLIDRDNLVEYVREAWANNATLHHIRHRSGPNGGHMPSLDQDGISYCWIHSGTMGLMLARAAAGLPYVRLSAFHPGCLIKNYRDEGGWGAQGLDFLAQYGCADVAHWPEKSMQRSNDTPEMRANALLHRVLESWMDFDQPAHDRNLSEDQRLTCLALNQPVIADRYRWGHSTIDIALKLSSQGQQMYAAKSLPKLSSLDLSNPADAAIFYAVIDTVGLNSWTDGWGDKGEFTMTGVSQRIDGGAALRAVLPSTN